jgi:hypothetical protein
MLFDVALSASKSYQMAERRAEGPARPGIRRVDSMDFLDQREEEDGDAGRTLRLSTSLQRSAKQSAPKNFPAANLKTTLIASGPNRPRATRSRKPRPSLLQRGRSFTAEDLAQEAEANQHRRDSHLDIKKPAAQIQRSASSSCLLPATRLKDQFLNHEVVGQRMGGGTGFSDSDDEGHSRPGTMKKIKVVPHTQVLVRQDDQGLRSPFEEKTELGF